jgi:hypothetical protein
MVTVLWDVMPYTLADRNQRFRGTCYLFCGVEDKYSQEALQV